MKHIGVSIFSKEYYAGLDITKIKTSDCIDDLNDDGQSTKRGFLNEAISEYFACNDINDAKLLSDLVMKDATVSKKNVVYD